MYFVIAGECLVILEDSLPFERIKNNLLVQNNFFGEVGCIYNCNRTCSVMTCSYNILARLTKPRLKNLLIDYPELRV
jgi:CRP-like cAMP-binding protein